METLAVDFIHTWLHEHGNFLSNVSDIRGLNKQFVRFFILWLFQEYRADVPLFGEWELDEYKSIKSVSAVEDYYRLQHWVKTKKSQSDNDMFQVVHYVTFEYCLFLLSKCPKLFGQELLKIQGYFKDPDSKIAWQVSLRPYQPAQV